MIGQSAEEILVQIYTNSQCTIVGCFHDGSSQADTNTENAGRNAPA